MTNQYATSGPAQRLLGLALREARKHWNNSGDAAGHRLGWSPSKISRFENGRVLPSAADLGQLIRLYKIPGDEADRLREIRQAAADGRELPGLSRDPTLTAVTIWAPDVIPQPLRTPDYTRAVMRAMRRIRHYTSSQVKAAITEDRRFLARLRGQPGDDGTPALPLTLTCILDESVLARRRGTAEVMTGEMELLQQVSLLGTTEIRVLPLDADGPTSGPFTYLGFADDAADYVQVDSPAGQLEITGENQVTDYQFILEDLLAASADTEESQAMIKRARPA